MNLCVGATSRLVVEEAAKLNVAQIVASRRQVNESGGYIGLTSHELVEVVRDITPLTQVVRDHGGPYQNGASNDDWMGSFYDDIDAGFDVLHVDVCKLETARDQIRALKDILPPLLDRSETTMFDIGGERNNDARLNLLLNVAESILPVDRRASGVVNAGGHAWADRQRGYMRTPHELARIRDNYARWGWTTKAHNMDWMVGRHDAGDYLDFYNIAPEFAAVEIDAWWTVMSELDVASIERYALESTDEWKRWYRQHEGTRRERARTAARYVWMDPYVQNIVANYDDSFVREAVRDAILVG